MQDGGLSMKMEVNIGSLVNIGNGFCVVRQAIT